MSDDAGTGGSDSFDAPWMEGVDRASGGGHVRWSPTLVVWIVLVAVFLADLATSGGLPGTGWRPTAMEWLLVFATASTATLGRAAVEAIPDRSTLWTAFRARPLALASLAYVAAFVLAGSVGVLVVGRPTQELVAAYQPPAFTSADVSRVPTCLGRVVDSRCYGTLRYPLGAGPHGQSMLTLAVHGASVALKVAVVVLGVTAPVATAVGVTAGYTDGWLEQLLVRVVEVVETFPAVLVYVVAAFVFGHSLFLIVVVFSLFSWASAARVVRAETERIATESYVRSAESAGADDRFVLRHHVLPNVADTVVVATFRGIPALILAEASLSFLGLSETDLLSWGRFVVDGVGPYFPDRFWLWGVPAAALVLTVVALDVVGDTLREATRRAE